MVNDSLVMDCKERTFEANVNNLLRLGAHSISVGNDQSVVPKIMITVDNDITYI